MSESFDQFMRHRAEAAHAYTIGDSRLVNELTAKVEPVTFFGPDGGRVAGADAVREAFSKGASQFEHGGDSRLEILQQAADGHLGYWSGIQHATVKMKGKDPVEMQLRITELFRRENGEWRLVHRHADMLKG